LNAGSGVKPEPLIHGFNNCVQNAGSGVKPCSRTPVRAARTGVLEHGFMPELAFWTQLLKPWIRGSGFTPEPAFKE
jgi:hypothetical protein